MTPAIALLLGRPLGGPLNETAWREILAIADRTLSTPLLRDRAGLPGWVRGEVEARIAKIAQRRDRLLETYLEAAQALEQARIEYVLLKGFTNEADTGCDPALRAQSDTDLLCRPGEASAARDALLKHGFVIHPGRELSDNHMQPLLKPHDWRWQGDYFDPKQPVPVEVHHTIWSAKWDRIATPGVEDFWERREWIQAAGLRVPAFCAVDRLGAGALHLLRHVLRNSVRPGQAWEIGRMLERRAGDRLFWEKWRSLHPAALRGLEAIAFQFVRVWFGVAMPGAPRKDWDALPVGVHSWLERFAFSPLENLTDPNKDVVWLHLALLPQFKDRWLVARRRLLPLRVPGAAEGIQGSYLGHIARRGRYHALALAGALRSGARASTARSKASHTSD